jgi:hypothetical protein
MSKQNYMNKFHVILTSFLILTFSGPAYYNRQYPKFASLPFNVSIV